LLPARPGTLPTLPDEVVVDAVKDEVDPGAVAGAVVEVEEDQQESLEHALRTTNASLIMTTAELPRRTEIKTTATRMAGTTHPIMTAPTAVIRTSFTTS